MEKSSTKKPKTSTCFLNQFITDLTITTDHFYSAFLEKQGFSVPTTEEEHLKVIQQLEALFTVLKKDKIEEIQKFLEEQAFSKEDKILAVLYIIQYGSLGEKIFDLLDAIQLSVNDSLSFKEIKSSIIPEEFKNTEEILAVLSHHLLATKKPKVIEKLMNRGIDLKP